MQPRLSFITLATCIGVGLAGCAESTPSIIGKWSGWMTVECPNGDLPAPNYRPLTISLDLTADGQCTNVHSSGIGADITSHDTYQLLDSLLLITGFWGTDTLHLARRTDTELLLRRAPYESGCVHFFTLTREAQLPKTP